MREQPGSHAAGFSAMLEAYAEFTRGYPRTTVRLIQGVLPHLPGRGGGWTAFLAALLASVVHVLARLTILPIIGYAYGAIDVPLARLTVWPLAEMKLAESETWRMLRRSSASSSNASLPSTLPRRCFGSLRYEADPEASGLSLYDLKCSDVPHEITELAIAIVPSRR